MGYYIDLEKISIDAYRLILETAYLPPSRTILKERLGERFGYIKKLGIKNIKELLQLLKKKEKFSELQQENCLSGDYLTILLRELNSILPKPNKLKDFADISPETIKKLEKIGIKNTVKLFERVINPEVREKLAVETGINTDDILMLTKLTDLSRIRWVGATAARMFYDLGVDSVEKISQANPVDLHSRINQLNKEKRIYKGSIGLNDMRIVVDIAKNLPLDIEY
jgi:hypothetical protein